MIKKYTLITILVVLFFSCTSKKGGELFSYVDATHSNIDFQNTITENEAINVIDFQYCYNGGGVGIGDFNADGLADIVFTGNQVSSKIYLNKGKLQFEDISEKSGLHTTSWVTGVSIVDINDDGWDDIYFNVGGANCSNDCPNLLYVNKGLQDNVPVFREEAAAYGLNDGNYAQQTVFFDYDRDGDLDAYIAHNGNTKIDKNIPVPKKYHPKALKDYLMENHWDVEKGHPVFTNVSAEMGIDHAGFGLGTALTDFNNDQWPDIYISNDFITEDLLYINQGYDSITKMHLGFSEKSKAFLGHETYNAMGVDISDINNDARPDILVLDMLPLDYERQKKMLGIMNYDKYILGVQNEYTPQYMHNTLQLNNGFIDSIPVKASEIGFMSGLSSTDWSWAPLVMDYDNDSDKDIYITNGYVKDITDLDFINFSNQNNLFGTPEARKTKLKNFVKDLPGIYAPNFFYENVGETSFKDTEDQWIPQRPSFSNGAAYADFDLDGDLDVVVNNINEKAFLLENTLNKGGNNHYFRIKLKGGKGNSKAIGTKLVLWENGKQQSQFQSVIKGYLSSVEPIVHFGTSSSTIDSLKIYWSSGETGALYNLEANKVWMLAKDSMSNTSSKTDRKVAPVFTKNEAILKFRHQENMFNDYDYQHLLMRQYSQMGPCIAAANIDGKPGDEIFIGGSKGQAGRLWFQNDQGNYEPRQSFDAFHEDVNAAFFDFDGDGDMDLYIASGGNEFPAGSELYQDRLYENTGEGYFTKTENVLATFFQNNGCIRPLDVDHDGDLDFFIGGRMVPQKYPYLPESKLMINTDGTFVEADIPFLENMGMVTDANWSDIDNDGWEDLTVVGEWMSITTLKNNKGKLEPITLDWIDEEENAMATAGWWNAVVSADFDGDGDMDFILGNQGLNGFIQPKQQLPIYLYKNDFDANGSPDPVLGQYYETPTGPQLLPVPNRDDMMKQLVSLKKQYLTYGDFAKADFKSMLKIKDLAKETLMAHTFASSYAENLGGGRFQLVALPQICQMAPINSILLNDFNADGVLDAVLSGNDFTGETHYGKHDALTGVFLKGKKKGGFEVVPSAVSGFYTPGQNHHTIMFTDSEGNPHVLVPQNNDKALVFNVEQKEK